MTIQPDNRCPCGSGLKFKDCCQPYLQGKKVLDGDTPEYVLRTRFSSAVTGNGDYMLKTWDADYRPDYDPVRLGEEMKAQNFTSLNIISIEVNENQVEARIEYYAHFRIRRSNENFHELASFKKKDGLWYYTDGLMLD